MLTKKHYWDIVEILCKEDASAGMIGRFASYLKHDNPKFDEHTFREALRRCREDPSWVKGCRGRRRR